MRLDIHDIIEIVKRLKTKIIGNIIFYITVQTDKIHVSAVRKHSTDNYVLREHSFHVPPV